MRNSVLGFNQEKLLQYNLSMNEVLLLSYIYETQASPKMEHIIKDEKTYTWLYHEKIHDDLPILNVSERQLKRYIENLVNIGLIKSERLANNLFRGSKSYYGITELCEELRYDQVSKMSLENYDQVSKMSLESTRPSVKNVPSDNKLSFNDSKLINTISKDIVENPKPKKLNLYQKCVNMINEFTGDDILRSYLEEFLKILLENSRESGKPFYANTFKGKLNSLKRLSDDNYIQRKIVVQTLDNGWNGFYELKENKSKRKVATDIGVHVKQADKDAFWTEVNNGNAKKF